MKVGPLLWRVVPEPELETWVARFARILELAPVAPSAPARPGERRMLVSRFDRRSPVPGLPAILEGPAGRGLPRSGWRLRPLFAERFWSHPESPDIVYEIPAGRGPKVGAEAMINACFPLLQDVVLGGGIPLHAALIARGGKGIGLAAAGGTGKSTCSRRIPPPWKAWCDDTLLVLPAESGGYEAHPFPTWSDYLWRRSRRTWDVSRSVPLRAIFFLKQAPTDKVIPIGEGEAAIYLGRSSNEVLSGYFRQFDKETSRALSTLIFDTACRVARTAPAFILEVSLTGRFWEEIEKVLPKRS